MSGGILTLAFEAPQGARTLPITPLLALLAAFGLVLVLDRGLALAPARRSVPLAARLAALAGGAAVAWIGVSNVGTFFSRQMVDPTVWESYSTRETVPAKAAAEQGPRIEAILGSATIIPSVQAQLLAAEWLDKIRTIDSSSDLPYRGRGPLLVFLDVERDAALADEVARYYPGATRRSISAPNSQRTLVEELILEPDVVAGQRGLMASFVGSDGTRAERRLPGATLAAGDAPVALPARVVLRAGLAVDTTGAYAVRTTDGFGLTIDGARLTSGQRVGLARGNHVVVVDGTLAPGGTVQISWQTPGSDQWRTLDGSLLFVAPDGGNGLEATFYPTPDWSGARRDQLIDPIVDHYFHLSPFRRLNIDAPNGWSAEWQGFVEIPTSGVYAFDVERISRAGLWIDEAMVFDDTPATAPETTSGNLELSAGRHAIRVRLQNRKDSGPRLYLYWTPPGGEREIVPGQALYPPPPRSS
jgi:hypothetical protein